MPEYVEYKFVGQIEFKAIQIERSIALFNGVLWRKAITVTNRAERNIY